MLMSKRNQFASCYKQENKQEKKTMLKLFCFLKNLLLRLWFFVF